MGTVHAKDLTYPENIPDQKIVTDLSARVDKIHFEGIDRTKEDVLLYAVQDLLQAEKFSEIILRANGTRMFLEKLNAFKNIKVVLDTSKGPEARADGYEITFEVEEKRHIDGKAGMVAGDNDGSIILGFQFPNLLGRGEAIETFYEYSQKKTSFNVSSSKPILAWINPKISQRVFSQTNVFPWNGLKEKCKGLGAEIVFESSPQVQHTIKWEGMWRNLQCNSNSVPFEIREEVGHSVKSSIEHILCMDQRDHKCLPTRGCLFRLFQEYAGLGGNVSFLKHEVEYQMNKAIYGDLVLQATCAGGIINPLGLDRIVKINDRFFIGGPLTLRGFALNGVGPHIHEHARGASVYWVGGLHAYAPLPFRPLRQIFDKICRTHFFLNVGNIGNMPFSEDFHNNISLLLSGARSSVGAGLVLAFGEILRLELNYCLPLAFVTGDRQCKGFQFGVGVNFL